MPKFASEPMLSKKNNAKMECKKLAFVYFPVGFWNSRIPNQQYSTSPVAS